MKLIHFFCKFSEDGFIKRAEALILQLHLLFKFVCTKFGYESNSSSIVTASVNLVYKSQCPSVFLSVCNLSTPRNSITERDGDF